MDPFKIELSKQNLLCNRMSTQQAQTQQKETQQKVTQQKVRHGVQQKALYVQTRKCLGCHSEFTGYTYVPGMGYMSYCSGSCFRSSQ